MFKNVHVSYCYQTSDGFVTDWIPSTYDACLATFESLHAADKLHSFMFQVQGRETVEVYDATTDSWDKQCVELPGWYLQKKQPVHGLKVSYRYQLKNDELSNWQPATFEDCLADFRRLRTRKGEVHVRVFVIAFQICGETFYNIFDADFNDKHNTGLECWLHGKVLPSLFSTPGKYKPTDSELNVTYRYQLIDDTITDWMPTTSKDCSATFKQLKARRILKEFVFKYDFNPAFEIYDFDRDRWRRNCKLLPRPFRDLPLP